jgi:AAA+ ATPase superfamily predicted ATPase
MQLRELIRDFGNEIGFNSLETNKNGVVHLTIHKIGDLFIDEKYSDESGGHVFIYLLRVYERYDGDLYRRALELCDFKMDDEFLINPVLHKDQALGFAVKYPIDFFNLNTFRKIIYALKDLQDRLEGETSR